MYRRLRMINPGFVIRDLLFGICYSGFVIRDSGFVNLDMEFLFFLLSSQDRSPAFRFLQHFLFPSSPFSLHSSLFTLLSSLFTLHSSPFSLHSPPFSLHSPPFTLHSSLFYFNVFLPFCINFLILRSQGIIRFNSFQTFQAFKGFIKLGIESVSVCCSPCGTFGPGSIVKL